MAFNYSGQTCSCSNCCYCLRLRHCNLRWRRRLCKWHGNISDCVRAVCVQTIRTTRLHNIRRSSSIVLRVKVRKSSAIAGCIRIWVLWRAVAEWTLYHGLDSLLCLLCKTCCSRGVYPFGRRIISLDMNNANLLISPVKSSCSNLTVCIGSVLKLKCVWVGELWISLLSDNGAFIGDSRNRHRHCFWFWSNLCWIGHFSFLQWRMFFWLQSPVEHVQGWRIGVRSCGHGIKQTGHVNKKEKTTKLTTRTRTSHDMYVTSMDCTLRLVAWRTVNHLTMTRDWPCEQTRDVHNRARRVRLRTSLATIASRWITENRTISQTMTRTTEHVTVH